MDKADPTPKRAATELAVKADPNTDRDSARRVHLEAMLGGVYANSIGSRIRKMFGGMELTESAMLYARDTLERMAPRDPMEEMLIAQALAAHARVMHLTSLANTQERLESIRTVHEYADRATNTYRRLMLALAEYRKPPRAGDSFTAIKQANIAGQQVVMNSKNSPREDTTNEQGSSHAQANHHAPETPEALSADTGGPGIPASVRGPSAARVRPWERATGPTTPEGKARSRMNAWKHGERSAEAMEQRAMLAELLRLLREESAELHDVAGWIDMASGAG